MTAESVQVSVGKVPPGGSGSEFQVPRAAFRDRAWMSASTHVCSVDELSRLYGAVTAMSSIHCPSSGVWIPNGENESAGFLRSSH